MINFFMMYIREQICNKKKKITMLAIFFSIAITSIFIACSMLIQTSTSVNYDSIDLRTITVQIDQLNKNQVECYDELINIENVEKVNENTAGRFEIVFSSNNVVKTGIDLLNKLGYSVWINMENQMYLEATHTLFTIMLIGIISSVILIFIVLLIFIIKIINDQISEIALFKAIGYKNIYINLILSSDFIIALIFSMLLCVPVCWLSESYLISAVVSGIYNDTFLVLKQSFHLENYLLIPCGVLILLCIALLSQSRKINQISTAVLLKE